MQNYTSEEKYQENRKNIKLIRNIVMIFGLILIALGIFIIAKNNVFLESSEPRNYYLSFFGFSMLIFGIFIAGASFIATFGFIHGRSIASYHAKQMKPVVDETQDLYEENVVRAFKNIKQGFNEADEESNKTSNGLSQKYCKHCGRLIDVNSKFCQYCGKEAEE